MHEKRNCPSSSAWISDLVGTSNENSHLHIFQMKIRSEKHGNSCSCYWEMTKPQQDLTLTCVICVLSWATFIFSMFSIRERYMLWVRASALAQPLFTPWQERAGNGSGCRGCTFLCGQSQGEEFSLPSGYPSGLTSSCLHSDVGRKETPCCSCWHGKKCDQVF